MTHREPRQPRVGPGLGQGIPGGAHDMGPKRRVHPDMGVEPALVILGPDQLGRRDGLGHGDDRLGLGQVQQKLLELRVIVVDERAHHLGRNPGRGLQQPDHGQGL